jgi:hypothetical protein
MPFEEPTEKSRIFQTFWTAKPCLTLNIILGGLETEDSELPDNELIEIVLTDIGLK